MIDEKKLIDDMKRLATRKFTIYPWYEGFIDALCDVEDLIKSQPKVGEWIPCSERMPDDNGKYLVTTSKGEVKLDFYFTFKDGGSFDDWRTIAWMPLPEPYREEEQ